MRFVNSKSSPFNTYLHLSRKEKEGRGGSRFPKLQKFDQNSYVFHYWFQNTIYSPFSVPVLVLFGTRIPLLCIWLSYGPPVGNEYHDSLSYVRAFILLRNTEVMFNSRLWSPEIFILSILLDWRAICHKTETFDIATRYLLRFLLLL